MLAVEGFTMEMRGISAAFFSSTTILNLATKHFSKYNLNIVNNAIISKIIVQNGTARVAVGDQLLRILRYICKTWLSDREADFYLL